MSTLASAIPPTHAASSDSSDLRRLWMKVAVFLGLATVAGLACLFIKPPATVSESGVVMRLPENVLGFTGKAEPISEGERVLLPSDTEIVKRLYTNDRHEQVNMQIVLSGVEHRSIHRPEICLKGQGWTISGGEIVKAPLKSGRNLSVMVLDISRPMRGPNGATLQLPALYAYFFVSKDAETPRHWDRLATTNLDLLFRNKSHRWAYVIAMAPVLKGFVPGGKDRAETLELIKQFLRETAPTFLKSEIPRSERSKSSENL
jgi:hypothetical protein